MELENVRIYFKSGQTCIFTSLLGLNYNREAIKEWSHLILKATEANQNNYVVS